jgi:hypothetical protein
MVTEKNLDPLVHLRTAFGDGRVDGCKYDEAASLREAARRIVGLLTEARRADVRAHFGAGDEVHGVRCGSSGATKGVRELAKILGLDESGLQRMGRVSERIRGSERDRLLALVDPIGFPLCWSHIEVLERMRDLSDRLLLAQAVLAEGLSVRDMRKRLR